MKPSPIHNKIVRPGSLKGYSYYYSNRASPQKSAGDAPKTKPVHAKKFFLIVVFLVVAGTGFALGFKGDDNKPKQSVAATPAVSAKAPAAQTPAPKASAANHCYGNVLAKLIKISVNQRHLWACEAGKTVQDAPVITGLQGHPETETPLGTYHVYGKQTNTTLKGTDSRGTWSDPVYYWIPFLDNQYGTYGFHDATWRAKDAFGNISPDSEEASHGCVELPLATSKWLYNWTPIHTTVTVES